MLLRKKSLIYYGVILLELDWEKLNFSLELFIKSFSSDFSVAYCRFQVMCSMKKKQALEQVETDDY